MLKYKIPQIVTLTRSNLVINPLIERQGGNFGSAEISGW